MDPPDEDFDYENFAQKPIPKSLMFGSQPAGLMVPKNGLSAASSGVLIE